MANELEFRKIEVEFKVKEIEARVSYNLKQVESQERISVTERNDGKNKNHGNGIRSIKFPNFNEKKDCLDEYLLKFERTCEAYKVPRELCHLTLARHL